MILWSGNYVLDDSTIDDLVNKLKRLKTYSLKFNHWSSYYINFQDRPENVLVDFYGEVLKKATSDLSLHHRSRYNYPFWMQVYQTEKESRHNHHDHFNGDTLMSWVHFLRPTDVKCFCFLDSEGNRTFPDQQNVGDLIIFPSWALHEVLPNNSDTERVVIAGNIEFSYIGCLHEIDKEYKQSYSYKLPKREQNNRDITIWEIYEDELD